MANKENKENVENDETLEDVELTESDDMDETVDDTVESLETKEIKVEDLLEEIENKNNAFLRLQADFTNYKKRNEKERASLVSLGMETIVSDILPILDNFERAMTTEIDNEDNFYKGVEMIQNQLVEVLQKNGLEEIKALHEKFDPEYHYAVQTQESEKYQSDVVLNVMQKGYILKDKVIRPAMVIVSE